MEYLCLSLIHILQRTPGTGGSDAQDQSGNAVQKDEKIRVELKNEVRS